MSWTTEMTPEGLAVHTWEGSRGPLLVLLHGLTDSGPSWEDAARRWSSTHLVVAPDALGHGRSRRLTRTELDSPDLVESMYAALEALLARLVAEHGAGVVAGHSMGGGLAAALASRRPDLVRGALLEDPVWFAEPADPSSARSRTAARDRVDETRWARRSLTALVEEGRRRNPTWPECELEPWAQAKADGDEDFLATGRAVLQQPWQEIAAALTVPTVVVTGTDGVIITAAVQNRIARLDNPHISVAVVPGADHCVRRTCTDAFHAVADPWLAALTGR